MERPYRIPLPDKAAFLVVIPPFFGIIFLFLISNWYTYLSCALSVTAGLTISKIRKDAKLLEDKTGVDQGVLFRNKATSVIT